MIKNFPGNYFSTKISKKQSSDTGMAMVLIFLLLGVILENDILFKLAIPILIMNMIYPLFYYRIAIIFLGLSHLLGTVVSGILLTLVYGILVVPTGLFRRVLGKDTLLLKQFKQDSDSVMKTRNYCFSPKDIEKPY